jgi:hypothetical protein
MKRLEPWIRRSKKNCGFRPKRSANGCRKGESHRLLPIDSQKRLPVTRAGDHRQAAGAPGGEAGSRRRRTGECAQHAPSNGRRSGRRDRRSASSATPARGTPPGTDRVSTAIAEPARAARATRRHAVTQTCHRPAPRRSSVWLPSANGCGSGRSGGPGGKRCTRGVHGMSRLRRLVSLARLLDWRARQRR